MRKITSQQQHCYLEMIILNAMDQALNGKLDETTKLVKTKPQPAPPSTNFHFPQTQMHQGTSNATPQWHIGTPTRQNTEQNTAWQHTPAEAHNQNWEHSPDGRPSWNLTYTLM